MSPDSGAAAASSPTRAGRPSSADARYGSAGKSGGNLSGKLVAIAAVLFVVVAAVVVWQYYARSAAQTVSATTAGFWRTDERTLELEVDVTRDNPEVEAYCIVTAQNYNVAEVGRREFVIPAGGARVQRFVVPIATYDTPVAGRVYGCAENPPSYLGPQARLTPQAQSN